MATGCTEKGNGDSQLREISGETISRDDHSVNVKPMPGTKIAKMKNVNIEDDVNVVIIPFYHHRPKTFFLKSNLLC